MERPLLTASSMKAWRRCPRYFWHKVQLGYRGRATVPALAFGTHAHHGWEAYWKHRQAHGIPGAHDAALDAIETYGALTPDPYVRVRLHAIFLAYTAIWDQEEAEVLEVEREFRMPLLHPILDSAHPVYDLGGKIDVILRMPGKGVLLVEHKTTSRAVEVGGSYRESLAMDGQISQYFLGAQALGYDPAACIYDVAIKPWTRPFKATPSDKIKYTKKGVLNARQRLEDESVEQYRQRVFEEVSDNPHAFIARIEVPRLERERESYAWDLWDQAGEILAATHVGRARRNFDACFSHGEHPCEFLRVCRGETSLSDPYDFVRVGSHPELSASGPT